MVPTMKPTDKNKTVTTAHNAPTPFPIVQSRGEITSDNPLTRQNHIPDYQRMQSIHTTFIPVRLHKVYSVPSNMVMLDDYYNKIRDAGDQRRRLHTIQEKSKGFGQSLSDIFFPNLAPRRIIKVRKGQPTTMKPLYTTLRAIRTKYDLTEAFI